MYVTERFKLPADFVQVLSQRPVPWGFGSFSEFIYYRTYSRWSDELGRQEKWIDTVVRVVEGVMSIRKDWYKKMGLAWADADWLHVAQKMAEYIYDMKFLPPGRGLWAMGTDYIYERGSAALNNCGAVSVTNDLAGAAEWTMDMLMSGVGVGFSTHTASFGPLHLPNPNLVMVEPIEDSKEGWANSVKLLINSYIVPGHPSIEFLYHNIRPAGSRIKGFGGVASGPDPLITLHNRIRTYLTQHVMEKGYSKSRLVADIFNAIGACVVAGNVRRSAQLAMGSIKDKEFIHLKDYDMFPYRRDIGWMSNNSIVLRESPEFEYLPDIADLIRDNGEPGIINQINVSKYARVGKKKDDRATLFNPCAEIPLESYELCNLVEVFPTRCSGGVTELWDVMKVATFYASTVALLPSHRPETNAVVARNRRIGVSISGVADWLDVTNLSHVTMALRRGYENYVEPMNRMLAADAGVPSSVRLTTVKPSGTVSLLAGVSPGVHWPTFRHGIRRVRLAENSAIVPILASAGVPYEKDVYSDGTLVFEFPLEMGHGHTRTVDEVSIWEKATMVAMLQREWADNSVSNTLTFTPEESSEIERVMAAFSPLVKSLSLLPSKSEAYAQMPEQPISYEEYKERVASIRPLDWRSFSGDGEDSVFCNNDTCEVLTTNSG